MKLRNLAFILASLFLSSPAFAAITSYDYVFVANDQYSSDFYDRINKNFTRSLTGGINNIESANIKDGSLLAADFADESSPVIRTYEGAACEFVYTGLIPATAASLTTNISAGTAYPQGYRIIKSGSTAHTFTASKWTWVDLDKNGNFQYSEVAIGGATPAIAANSVRLAKVSTDTGTVLVVSDLRKTSCTNGPFSIISDAPGEASLGNVLNNPQWGSGLNVVTNDATTVYINPGTENINGSYRALTTQKSVSISTVGSAVQGTSGLDAGSVAGSTTYYLYGVADVAGVVPPTILYSTSSSAPSGAINYRRIGETKTDASSSLASADATSVSYNGKIRQIKKYQTGEYATGSTNIPADDSIPQISEGDQYMSLDFTAVNASDRLFIQIEAVCGVTVNSEKQIVALFKDAQPDALASMLTHNEGNPNYPTPMLLNYTMTAGTTGNIAFTVRIGGASGTIAFNGLNGTGRLMGGTLVSSITITEYEA